jgi:hypothetical protein
MRLRTIGWSPAASRFYLPLLSQQRRPIDALLGDLRQAEAPSDVKSAPFRPIEDYPGYWFAKTPTDVLMVVQQRADAYVLAGFADWQAQLDQALEEAAAALAADESGAAEAH